MNAACKSILWTLISLMILIPIGFYSKAYRGPAFRWVNDSLGGVFYEIFWCLFLFLFFPRIKPWKIASLVLIFTCGLEFLQLWHQGFLELIRNHFIGRTLIGHAFTWSDFPYYFIGCALGWIWMRSIEKRIQARTQS